MLDLSHFPAGADVQMYRGHADRATVDNRQLWTKPRGANFVFIWACGSGAGGGGGFSAAVGSTKGGGGGGGSSGMVQALWLARSLPDYISVRAAAGGSGGAAGAVGVAGGGGIVESYSGAATQNRIIIAISSNAAFGAAGTGAAGGAGGIGSIAATAANCPLINLALAVSFVAGRTGTNGNIATPLDTSIGTTLPILGGAGGGGYTAAGAASAGGKMAFSGYLPDLPGGAAGGAVGGRGSDGLWLPPYIFGGTGGGGTNDAVSVGGRGGDGIAPGAGGGGGGGGVTGGRGGDGGPGLVVIVSWA